MCVLMQITSLYGGPIEFLFIVESTEDPAYHAVSRLMKDFQVFSLFFIFHGISMSWMLCENRKYATLFSCIISRLVLMM